jgi:cell division protein FtsQ
MDGGRRLAGALRERIMPRLNESARTASDELPNSGKSLLTFGRVGFRIGQSRIKVHPGMGTFAALGFIGMAGVAGWFIGGHHEGMRQGHGAVRDIAARSLGFPIRVVDVTGVKELAKDEILAASGMGPTGSLLFLNVNQVRTNVKALPLVAEATVRKLYPDRVNIQIVEREPFALWQQDGTVHVVSNDGTIIDSLRDQRYLKLPHVVGANAHKHVKDYVALLDQVPEFRSEIRAGVLVSERRWNLKLNNGVEVKLPEVAAADALRQLIKLHKSDRVLSKDIISVDLRVEGRAAFRLTEESASARIEDFAKRLPKIRGRA